MAVADKYAPSNNWSWTNSYSPFQRRGFRYGTIIQFGGQMRLNFKFKLRTSQLLPVKFPIGPQWKNNRG